MMVARVIAKFEPGGAQLGIIRLIRGLQARGIESRVLVGAATPAGLRLARDARIDFEAWTEGRDLQYECASDFVEWLRPRMAGADAVHAHMFGAWWAASRAVAPRMPLIASEHNAIQWPAKPRLAQMAAALERVDACFAHGPEARAAMFAQGIDRSRLLEGHSAIEEPAPAPLSGLPTPRLIFAGRLHAEKGPDLLLSALALLRAPPATFLLGSGPLEDSLHATIRRLGLGRVVTLTGWQRRVGPWLRGAGACVVPSRHEAWSQTAVTAMAHSVPVVATAVEGLPTTLAENRGVLVPPENPRALARAIELVMAGRHDMDLAGARRYASRFSVDRVAARYEHVLRELVGRGSRAAAVA